jgi:glucose-6-phosphate dehydrogenase assembly protein OpcA
MQILDSRTAITVAIGLFTAVAVATAAIGYVEQSSDAALAEFIRAANEPASEHAQPVAKGKTGCPVAKRELPTQLIPFL